MAKKMQLSRVLIHLNAFPGLGFNSLHIIQIHNPLVLINLKLDFDPITQTGARLLT